jgi:MazG family protein
MPENETSKKFERLIEIVKILRGPDGCMWDKKQTHESLIPYFLEEMYEVIDSIQEKNAEKLKEELGDLLLHIVFQSQLGEEEGKFTLADSIDYINEKLVRRHPHVFDNVEVEDIGEIRKNWEDIKLNEGRKSLMEGVPKTLPALLQARRVQERASEVGFDWEHIENVWDKISEELEELKKAIESRENDNIKNEVGDILFTMVNLSRFLNINPEEALRETVRKFIRRFSYIKNELEKEGKSFSDVSLSEMDDLWNEIKDKEN